LSVPSWFWWIGTSDIALAVLAVVLVVGLLISEVDRIAVWLPWLKPFTAWGRPASYLALGLLALFSGYRVSDESAALKQAKIDLAFTRLQLDTQKQTADTAAKLRAEAEAKAEAANQKVTDYEADLAAQPQDSNCTLTDDDVRRLREIAH
jgi:hypothetical protein